MARNPQKLFNEPTPWFCFDDRASHCVTEEIRAGNNKENFLVINLTKCLDPEVRHYWTLLASKVFFEPSVTELAQFRILVTHSLSLPENIPAGVVPLAPAP